MTSDVTLTVFMFPCKNNFGCTLVKFGFVSFRGIEQIICTDMSQENVTIQYSSDVINKTVGTKVAQVQFLALTLGLRQICLNATDR